MVWMFYSFMPQSTLKKKSNPEKKLGIGSPVFCTFLFAPQPNNLAIEKWG